MANYSHEIMHMMDRFLIKILNQDKNGFYRQLTKYKFTLVDILLLRRLDEVGSERMNALIDYLEVDRNLFTTTMKKMMGLKLIKKVQDEDDGRGQKIEMTPDGKAFYETFKSESLKEMSFILNDLTINEEKAILKFLSKSVQYHTDRFDPKNQLNQ